MKVNILPVTVLYLALLSIPSAKGARILAVLSIYAKSHHNFFQPVLKALARAGHEVVVYSPFPLAEPVPNYTEVILDKISTQNENITEVVVNFMESPSWKCVDVGFYTVDWKFKEFVENDKIRSLLSSKEKFDVVITEVFANQEFSVILGHVLNTPVIALHAFFTHNIANSVFGNSLSLSYIPDVCTSFSNKMNIIERALNTIYSLRGLNYIYYNKYLPYLEHKLKRHFPDSPPLLDMINNVSLIFVNDHLTADYAQPRTPNIIPVAGIHIEDKTPLPKVIQKFIDEATDGVVFFSLGTYVPDERKPMKYFDMYINVFRQLRQRVLWKTRKENIQGLPDNVMTVKWAPQRDILDHPKCVLFITHGGLLSQHEAVHFGVPVVVIPQFFDQHRNAKFYEETSTGVKLNTQDLSETTVLTAIRSVLQSPEYKRKIERLSRIFRDRPMTPAQTVVYWTEYVLRHGASHLRPASSQLSWYQLALLDVLSVILALFLSVTLVFFFTLRRLITYFHCESKDCKQIKDNYD